MRFPLLARALALVAATAVSLEIGALLVLATGLGGQPPRSEIQGRLDAVESVTLAAPEPTEKPESAMGERRRGSVLHPYLGYVRRSERGGPKWVNQLVVWEPVNEYGFFGDSLMAPRRDGAVRVALMGGSVALELFLHKRETLAAEIERLGAFGGRSVEIVSIALGGFKQPQQLQALTYFVTLGAPIDAVINLDGFNELTLPVTDNAPMGLAVSYPFRWLSVASGGIDVETARIVTAIDRENSRASRWQGLTSRPPWRYSALALLAWNVRDQRAQTRRGTLETALRERLAERSDPNVTRGPRPENSSPETLVRDAVGLWANASIQMAEFCASNDIRYFHFLQPTQYLSDSKRLSETEERTAIAREKSATRLTAQAGYPALVATGRELVRRGVPFFDLTDVFANESGDMYRDRCCHYTMTGYERIAARIARAVAGD